MFEWGRIFVWKTYCRRRKWTQKQNLKEFIIWVSFEVSFRRNLSINVHAFRTYTAGHCSSSSPHGVSPLQPKFAPDFNRNCNVVTAPIHHLGLLNLYTENFQAHSPLLLWYNRRINGGLIEGNVPGEYITFAFLINSIFIMTFR